MATQKIGAISPHIAATLGLPGIGNAPVYLGDSNVTHMQARHPAAYAKYASEIPNIISSPDYVGVNQKDGSIEYVKDFVVNGEFVKVAVRVSSSGKHFARSLYILNSNRVNNFIAKGTLKKV